MVFCICAPDMCSFPFSNKCFISAKIVVQLFAMGFLKLIVLCNTLNRKVEFIIYIVFIAPCASGPGIYYGILHLKDINFTKFQAEPNIFGSICERKPAWAMKSHSKDGSGPLVRHVFGRPAMA